MKQKLEIKPVKWVDEVVELALEHPPEPLSEEQIESSDPVDDESASDAKNPQSGITAH